MAEKCSVLAGAAALPLLFSAECDCGCFRSRVCPEHGKISFPLLCPDDDNTPLMHLFLCIRGVIYLMVEILKRFS